MLTCCAAIIIIGNEILSGQTHDTNLNYLACRLQALGIVLQEVRVVRDETAAIVEAVNSCRQQFTYVFTTGGIGPTHDDITSAAVAEAFGVPLERHKEAADLLYQHYPSLKGLEARLKMAEIPQGAQLIPNKLTIAPGFKLDNVFVMAGIPDIMQAMFEEIVPQLKAGPLCQTRMIHAKIFESHIAHELTLIQQQYPKIEIGSYPKWRPQQDHGICIVIKGYSVEDIMQVEQQICQMLSNHGVTPDYQTQT